MQSKNNNKLRGNLNDPLDQVKAFLRHASPRKVHLPCTAFGQLLEEALHTGRRKAEDMQCGKEGCTRGTKRAFRMTVVGGRFRVDSCASWMEGYQSRLMQVNEQSPRVFSKLHKTLKYLMHLNLSVLVRYRELLINWDDGT